jgi:subfamily B ATP-binding cassette protein HlyB/CyaB
MPAASHRPKTPASESLTPAAPQAAPPSHALPPGGQTREGVRPGPTIEEPAYTPRHARRYPAVLQLSETDCGAACLSMALRYYRKYVSINRLREMANVGTEGATLHSVSQAAEMLGFRTRAVRAAFPQLCKIKLPAIAHWEGNHYVIVYQATPGSVLVADPQVGLRRLSPDAFCKGWTGILLLLTPTPQIENVETSRTSLGRYLPLLKPYSKLLFEIFVASLVLQLFGLASPICTQIIMDKALVHKSVSMMNLMLIGMFLLALFQAMTVALRQYLMVHTSRRLDLDMVVAFYRHLLSLPMRYFESRKVGDIIKRFEDNARLREMMTGRALGVLLDCLMVVVYLGLMLVYNVKLTLVALIFMPAYALLTWLMTPIMQRQYRESFTKIAESESHLVESVTGVGTVKATASERFVRWKLEGLMVRALNVEFRSALTNMTTTGVASILESLNTVLLFWYGARLVIAGELTVGQLVAFNVLVGMVTRPVLNTIELWHDLQQARIALERLSEVFDTPPEEPDPATQIVVSEVHGHIKFENVTFHYPSRPDRNALDGINLEIHPGQTVALVGRSGAGKTTFAGMLLRLHETNAGRILIDGHDIRQLSLPHLRARIGVVPQDVFLFSGTIRENIAFGYPDATMAEVVAAATLAGAHVFVSELPFGYETIVGERGQSLSGGQKQRIAIARALFSNPRILVLDEATSALDLESERAIQQNLDSILHNRTTFVIAHRLSTVRNADLIVVLDQGRIAELGTHHSLLEQRGLYYHLNSQQLEN